MARYVQKTDKHGHLMFDPETGEPIMVLAKSKDEGDENPGQFKPQPASVGCALSQAANPSMTAPKKEKKKKGK